MTREHRYTVEMKWTGNLGSGTSAYAAYSRDHVHSAGGKPVTIPGSSDPAFRGDASRYNPEELLVAALSSCHMLWYLHLCADAGIVVESYEDSPVGLMIEERGEGQFTRVTLAPRVTIRAGDSEQAHALHQEAHRLCFIARSVNFPVQLMPSIERAVPTA